MTPTIGKRKRATEEISKLDRESSPQSPVVDEEDAEAIFRRHFEAQFKPLPDVVIAKPPVTQDESDEDDGDESDWDGISDDETAASGRIEVIEHTAKESRSILSKSEMRALLSSKPPTLTAPTPVVTSKGRKRQKPDAENDLSEIANTNMDLALQRLLTESHLLDKSTLEATGINRHKATDLRIQKLGAKTSIFDQVNMPKSHRIGMNAKSAEREAKRRREAKENNVVLELPKEKKRAIHKIGKRGMNVSMPGVGSFAGATLRLSKKDINDIEGPKKSFGGGGRGGKVGKRR